MTSQPQILHGPRLSLFKVPLGEKRRPPTWALSVRAIAPTVDAVEKIAKQNGCTVTDIIRTAIAEFLAKYEDTNAAHNGHPLTAHHSPREASINAGLIPLTHAPNRAPQPSQNLSAQDKPTNTQTSSSGYSPSKREGMKDKLSSF